MWTLSGIGLHFPSTSGADVAVPVVLLPSFELNLLNVLLFILQGRAKPYLPQICGTIKWRLNNKSAKIRQQAADLIARIALVMKARVPCVTKVLTRDSALRITAVPGMHLCLASGVPFNPGTKSHLDRNWFPLSTPPVLWPGTGGTEALFHRALDVTLTLPAGV